MLELRDKILKLDMDIRDECLEGKEGVRSEAVDALVALGYSRIQSERAMREVIKMDSSAAKSVEELVRACT